MVTNYSDIKKCQNIQIASSFYVLSMKKYSKVTQISDPRSFTFWLILSDIPWNFLTRKTLVTTIQPIY